MNLIFDGNYLLHRMIWAKPTESLKNSSGFPTGGILGTLRAVRDSLITLGGYKVFFVLDGGGYSERRKALAPEYKEARSAQKDDPIQKAHYESFQTQRVVIKELLADLACRVIDIPGMEGDDVIAWLSRQMKNTVVISDDMDLLQVVDKRVSVYRPMKGDKVMFQNFEEIVGVPHRNFLLMKATTGRESVKGVKGFGKKSALEVFSDPLVEDLDTLVAYCHMKGGRRLLAVAESRDLIEKNLEVMDLFREQMYPENETKIRRSMETGTNLYRRLEQAVDMFTFLEFGSVLKDLPHWLAPFSRLS